MSTMASVLDPRLGEGIQLSHKLIETHVFGPNNVSLIIIQIIQINVVDHTRIHNFDGGNGDGDGGSMMLCASGAAIFIATRTC